MLSTAQLLSRLDRQLSLLTRSSRDAAHHHASLEAAIEASWTLLTPSLQDSLVRCTAFAGGFDLAAAEAVLGDSALDALHDLRDRSLVVFRDDRFALYDSIRAFASARIVDHDARARHAAHYADAGARLAAALEQSGSMEALAALAAEGGNLRNAREHSADVRIALALDSLLLLQGPPDEHAALLDGDERLVVRAARAALRLDTRAGIDRAAALLSRAHASDPLYAELSDEIARRRGRAVPRKVAPHEIRASEHSADPRLRCEALLAVAGDHRDHARLKLAEQTARRALQLARDCQCSRHEAAALLLLNDDARAAAHDIAQRSGDVPTIATVALARLREVLGSDVPAHLEDALVSERGAIEALDAGPIRAELHAIDGLAARRRGDDAAAALCFERAAAHASDPLSRQIAALHAGDRDTLQRAIAGEHRPYALRVAAAVFERSLPPPARRDLWADALDPSSRALVVERGGTSFRPPGGEWVDLGKRQQLAKLVLLLAECDEPLTTDDFIKTLWPGENLLPEAAAGRVYTALAALRRKGMRSLLDKRGNGYALDASLRVLVVPQSWRL